MTVRPWVRFWARNFDYALLFTLLSLILDFTTPIWRAFFWLNILWVWLVATLLWIPIEAFSLSIWGTTPGKSLLRVHVLDHGKPLPFARAFKRAYLVWIAGLGLGIFILTQVLQILSYRDLTQQKTTRWDRACHTRVTHRDIGSVRIVLFIVLFTFIDGLGPAITGRFFYTYFFGEQVDLKF